MSLGLALVAQPLQLQHARDLVFQNGPDATTPGPWRLLYSSAYLHRLTLEEGEVIGRGLRSLR
jgi:hypothetical protein